MRKEKHIEELIGLMNDIRKEPSPAVVGFIYSTAAVHMFHIAFSEDIDSGRNIKHKDFGSTHRIEKIKLLIKDFDEKERLFSLWREMELKRNQLCYGHPTEKDLKEYSERFFMIKELIERVSGIRFDIASLERLLMEIKGEKDE